METIWLPAAAAAIVFITFLLLMPKRISSEETVRKRSLIEQMSQNADYLKRSDEIQILKDQIPLVSGLFGAIPGVKSGMQLVLKSGLQKSLPVLLFCTVLITVIIIFLLLKAKLPMVVAASGGVVGALWLVRSYLRRRIRKRNDEFIKLFPDAVDMIVRSVRSGHPLNTAMRMIADNMDNPVRDEFKQVVDEISYGRSLPEALIRLSQRIDEPDLHFFVVVLSVHQETGGSLAEVLTNLSSIIRKRKQLRLKIRALTAEGRATGYVLGALPLVELGALYLITPNYLTPLFVDPLGRVILVVAIILIIAAQWIVRAMVNFDI